LDYLVFVNFFYFFTWLEDTIINKGKEKKNIRDKKQRKSNNKISTRVSPETQKKGEKNSFKEMDYLFMNKYFLIVGLKRCKKESDKEENILLWVRWIKKFFIKKM